MAGFCQSGQSSSGQPVWADPLGPTSIGPRGTAQYGASGAPQIRSNIYSQMQGMNAPLTAAASQVASGAAAGMNSPAWREGQNLATQNLSGQYLHGSPELDAAMAANRAGTLASAADAAARQKSDYTRAGMGWSTGNQQAAQSDMAAAGAQAGRTNADIYAQNYANERANQNAAPGQYAAATAAPLNYLNQATMTANAPLQVQGNLLSGLSSGGQVITPNQSSTSTSSMGSNIMNGISALLGAV